MEWPLWAFDMSDASHNDILAAVQRLQDSQDKQSARSDERYTKLTNEQLRTTKFVQELAGRMDRSEHEMHGMRRDIADTASGATRRISDSNLEHERDKASIITQLSAVTDVAAKLSDGEAARKAQVAKLSEVVAKLSEAEAARKAQADQVAKDTKKLTDWRRSPMLNAIVYAVVSAILAYLAAHQAPASATPPPIPPSTTEAP